MHADPADFRTVTVSAVGTKRVLTDSPLTIGRDPGVDIQIDFPGVSRHHATVRLTTNACVFEDEDSHNGSYHNGKRIKKLVIEDHASIRLGDPVAGPTVVLAYEPVTPGPPSPGLSPQGPATETHPTRGTITSIGRAPGNDIVIDDLMVSRSHATVEPADTGRLLLTDLGSHNGTTVNGTLVDKTTLEIDDIVGIGSHLFRVIPEGLEEYVDTGSIRFDVEGITVEVGEGLVLLDDVTFGLPEKSLLAVIGPSGSGKTTLLNALTGFRPAQKGRVLYAGLDLYTSYDALRQRIGYVPQDDILHPGLGVRRALEYAAKLRFPPDVARDERGARVTEIMNELGLIHRSEVPISRLSGGQRKRASVGFELLTKPSLIFLDEPTSGLDPGYERSLTRLLRDLADGGRTVVVVTHSVQSLDLCDRLLVLAPGGRVAFFGRPDQAPSFFETKTFSELYEKLEQDEPQVWPNRFERSAIHRRRQGVIDAQRTRPALGTERHIPAPPKQPGWLRQFATLTRRYGSVIAADRRLLILMVLQAPLLGGLLLALGGNRYLERGSDALDYSLAKVMLAVIVLGVTWLGLSNAIREVVKERDVYQRERAVGLSISAYLASKVCVLGTITILQSAALVLIATAFQGNSWGYAVIPQPRLELVIDVALAGVAAMALGLFISTLTKSTDRAMTILPLVLILQLILSGLIPAGSTVLLDYGRYGSSAYWGLSATASTVDLAVLEAFNDCLAAVGPDGTEGGLAGDLAANWVCVRLLRETEDAAVVSASFDRTFPEYSARVDALIAASGDRDRFEEILADPEDGFGLGSRAHNVAEVVLGDPPLRFWDQTAEDWMVNISVLLAMTLLWLVAAGTVLRLQDAAIAGKRRR